MERDTGKADRAGVAVAKFYLRRNVGNARSLHSHWYSLAKTSAIALQ